MDTFDRVYFETNVLLTGGWPIADASDALLEPILKLARDLDIELFVPGARPIRNRNGVAP